MKLLYSTTIFLLSLSVTHGFLNPFQPEKVGDRNLIPLSETIAGATLELKLDVGSNDYFHMNIQGLQMELSGEDASSDKLRPRLPGSEGGPNPQVSAGAKTIVIKQEPYIVTLNGKETISLSHGCWELVWREGAGAGVIICGFLLEKDVERNDAILNKGRIYMSLPVWTNTGLTDQQEYKKHTEARAKKHMDEQLDAFKKMDSTSNVIEKALFFRNAAQASEKLSSVPIETAAQIPWMTDVIPLGDEMKITTKGTAWRKEERSQMFGGTYTYHHLLGSILVSPGKETPVDASLKP